MTERHTGVNIGQEILGICDEFDVGTKVALVTDNASNMAIAAKECDMTHVNCFSHTLQLAVEDGLKIDQISKTLSVSRKLVGHFSHSSLALNALFEKEQGESKLKLVQDVPTRWNSSFQMIECLLRLRVPIYSVIFDDNITKPGDRVKLDLKDNYWSIMEAIVSILGPLAEITEILGKEDVPTGSSVHIVLYNIFRGPLSELESDSQVVKSMKKRIKVGLQKRFCITDDGKPNVEDTIPCLLYASFLDPRYKNILQGELLCEVYMGRIQGEILNQMVLIDEGDLSNDESGQVNRSEPIAKQAKYDWKEDSNIVSWSSVLQGGVVDLTDGCNTAASAADELNEYMREVVRVSNPLDWWKMNANSQD